MKILEKLKYERVFSVEKQEDGMFMFGEECDQNFAAFLTKEEVIELAEELIALTKKP